MAIEGLLGKKIGMLQRIGASGEIELHQRVHRLRSRIDDVEQTLMGAHLELLAAFLVDVRRTVDRKLLDPGRQRNRTAHLRAGTLGRGHDLTRRRVEDAVIERLEANSDVLAVHRLCSLSAVITRDSG